MRYAANYTTNPDQNRIGTGSLTEPKCFIQNCMPSLKEWNIPVEIQQMENYGITNFHQVT